MAFDSRLSTFDYTSPLHDQRETGIYYSKERPEVELGEQQRVRGVIFEKIKQFTIGLFTIYLFIWVGVTVSWGSAIIFALSGAPDLSTIDF